AVLHFAASLNVPESVSRPLDYYANNTCNTLNLLRCCHKMGVKQIIFSSTAAVYGQPEKIPVTEYTPTQPINPYGRSKLACEWLIRDYAQASDLRYVILRYFNVAGAEPGGRLGQMLRDASHLIRVSCDAALQRRTEVKIFGTDFPTPDGTAIRDYIHVEDLAAAHLDALTYLEQGKESQVLNCGYGQGYSVREVIERVKVISGVDFPVIDTERRPGDPACVIAGADKIGKLLGWQPKYNDLDKIVSSTLAWEMYQKSLMLN
ncbi:UDP-glucose 4-epimerase GalE, partial [Nodularia spumigena]|uniref:UDP-glucose 4-epimerase GalE n=1 Tax=Nodularia spumigena TaxID=70799 RepID=UPI0030DD63B3